MQVEGSNYLIPIDADITREAEVEIDAVQADLVLKQMAFAGSRVNIVILDACRNNPLARDFRSIAASQGFAEMHSKPKGTFISYSTAPGEGRGSMAATATARSPSPSPGHATPGGSICRKSSSACARRCWTQPIRSRRRGIPRRW